MDSTQEEIFEKEIKQRIPSLLEGLNTTVFAYGNTGAGMNIYLHLQFSNINIQHKIYTGKTFTMQGSDDKLGTVPVLMKLSIVTFFIIKGIIPRVAECLITKLNKLPNASLYISLLSCSYHNDIMTGITPLTWSYTTNICMTY